jgi:hypothetical protein
MLRMGRLLATAVLALAATQATPPPSGSTPFNPFADRQLATVNAVEFTPDGEAMYAALFLAAVEKSQGRAAGEGAPEIALYESRREGSGWSEPRLLPFSGRHKDYEASLSPDGLTMIFNSWRPLPDGTAVTNRKNNLWMVRRAGDGWGQPVYLGAVNRLETEESYATQTADGRLFYVQEGAADANGPDWSIHTTRIVGDSVEPARPFEPAASAFGEGDPWVAPDGSYLIFTRWDRSRDWSQAADLYITFDGPGGWTEPAPIGQINDPSGPDYAVSIHGDTIYWKRRGGTFSIPWRPILAALRQRV